ncbi:MAG: thiamine-phosphate kinase [Chitinispirillales bacterium]|jgi:thiamine-monophosphate kinase|nr:thiamine-phosphate kinase [Chitinispirillales bacterium]
MTERELIRRLQNRLPIADNRHYELTIGDDAAIRVNETAGERLIITADVSVESVHFSLDTMTFEEIGYRSMVANLSDCAAMGALPDSAIVQLVFPKKRANGNDTDINESIERIYDGFARACARWNFPIIGGDLSRGDSWIIGITLIGAVPPTARPVKRTGIVDGDALWMTGTPGKSAAGLACLQHWGRENIPARYQQFAGAHISPIPKISEGVSFAACKHVHAMMDLSDGLSKDVAALCSDNSLGFIFDKDLQPGMDMINLSTELTRDWRDWFYHGGEEYELLVACDSAFDLRGAVDNVDITRLGRFTSKLSGMFVQGDDGGMEELSSRGWDHIRNEL